MNKLAELSLQSLFTKYEGYAARYIQTGEASHLQIVEAVKVEIRKRVMPTRVKVVKRRGERITAIEFEGERFTWDSGSTFRGGVKRK